MKLIVCKEFHLPEVLKIERDSFADPWSFSSFYAMINSPSYDFMVLTGEESAEVYGYIIGCAIAPEGEIANLAVRRDLRGRGYGEFILQEYISLCGRRGVTSFFLEVRKSNIPARALYVKNRFEEIGVRRNYYRKPREDAIVMRREGSLSENGK